MHPGAGPDLPADGCLSGRSGGALAASTLRQYVSGLSTSFAHRGLAKPWGELIERLQHAAAKRAQHNAGLT